MSTKSAYPRLDTDLDGVLSAVMEQVKKLHKDDPLDLVFLTPLISGIHESEDINQVYFFRLWPDEITEETIRKNLEALQQLGFVAEIDMCGWNPNLLRRRSWNGGKPQPMWVLSR